MTDTKFNMKTLLDYEVISVMGSGAFGTCFKVRDKETGQTYAWKGMDYDELSEKKKESLISEINVLRQLQHPNIVQYYHHLINHETKSIFIVMECCEGGDLSQLIERCRLEKRRFEEKYIWRVLFQLCKALQVCHNKIKEGTILHRDIKPANIFLDAEGNAKLGDFGLARVLRRNETFAETFVGTPYYMSPEIVKGSKYDRTSDVWAVGCLTYELCSLRPPFRGKRFEQLSRNISGGKFNSIPECYSSDLQNIISFMLEVDSEQRPDIDVITRHPILVRNVVDIPNEFPKLIPVTATDEVNPKWKLSFSPKSENSSLALTHFTVAEGDNTHITGVYTPALRSEIFGSIRQSSVVPRSLMSSDPELYESIRLEDENATLTKPTVNSLSPTTMTQNVFERELQNRLHAIRAHESLLQQREENLNFREQKLNERERRILERERDLEAKQVATEMLAQRLDQERKSKPQRQVQAMRKSLDKSFDDTYCSIDSTEIQPPPTVARLNLAALPPPKSFNRKVTFKSPKKFTKYNIENVPPPPASSGRDSKASTLRTSISSKTSDESDGGHSHKRKSILSIFGLNKGPKDTKPAPPLPTPSTRSSTEVLDKCEPEELSTMWTTENKRAAFDMLAAMNAAAGKLGNNENGLMALRQCRQSVRERSSSSNLRRNQNIRRSIVGLPVGVVQEHSSRIIL